jgi:hypothetical protein
LGRQPEFEYQDRKDVVRLQAAYGSGIENYFNDAPVDVGIVNNFSNATRGLNYFTSAARHLHPAKGR